MLFVSSALLLKTATNEPHSSVLIVTTTIQQLLTDDDTPSRQLRPADRTRLQSTIAIIDANFADLEEFIDGDLHDDAYFLVESARDEDIQRNAFEVYRLLHNYLSALYSFNEAVRVTVTNYLPGDDALSKRHFDPSRRPGVEYIRRLMFVRGLRIAAQHGAFSDTLPVTQWDLDEPRYRLGFDESAICATETIHSPGMYLRFTSDQRRQQPLEYNGSFHQTNFHPFYTSCRQWFDLG